MPFFRQILNCSSDRTSRHSLSVLVIFSSKVVVLSRSRLTFLFATHCQSFFYFGLHAGVIANFSIFLAQRLGNLTILRASGLVGTRREGNKVINFIDQGKYLLNKKPGLIWVVIRSTLINLTSSLLVGPTPSGKVFFDPYLVKLL